MQNQIIKEMIYFKAKINFDFLLISIFLEKKKSSKFQKKTYKFFFEHAILYQNNYIKQI